MGQILIDKFKAINLNNTANAAKEKYCGNRGQTKYRGKMQRKTPAVGTSTLVQLLWQKLREQNPKRRDERAAAR